MNRQEAIIWIAIGTVVACCGCLYSWISYGGFVAGGIYAVSVCLPIIAFERNSLFPALKARILRLPTLGYLGCKLLLYGFIFQLGFLAAGTTMWVVGILDGPWHEAAIPHLAPLLYRLLLASGIIALLRIGDLIGRRRLLNLVIGKYRKPAREDRIFLFIDLAGSTAFAERKGDLAAVKFLTAFLAHIGEAANRNRGTVDDYIGDAVIVSWNLREGIANSNCLLCIADVLATIDKEAETWRANFGQVPCFRTALHGGSVVTAEVGVQYHKITYFGDTINTAARLEALSRELDRPILMSRWLFERVGLPSAFDAEDLGDFEMKGKRELVGVVSIAPK